MGTAAAAAQPVQAAAVHWGGFWIRFLAIVIDVFLIQIALTPLRMMLHISSHADFGAPGTGPTVHFAGLSIVVSWLYEALMESSTQQATLGKLMLGLKVTDLQGNRISFARATGRHFAKIISGIILLIGFIMAGFTERKQALHDMIAGTLVRYR